eukprot:1141594-Pleurochrysis_carterae.AAC.4
MVRTRSCGNDAKWSGDAEGQEQPWGMQTENKNAEGAASAHFVGGVQLLLLQLQRMLMRAPATAACV